MYHKKRKKGTGQQHQMDKHLPLTCTGEALAPRDDNDGGGDGDDGGVYYANQRNPLTLANRKLFDNAVH